MKKRYEHNHFKAFSNSINKKKLYKKGKNWIIGSLTLLALTGMGMTVQQNTHADTTNTKANTTSVGSTDDIEHRAKAMYTSVVAANITNPSTGKPTQNSNSSYQSNSQSVATHSATATKNSVSSSASKVSFSGSTSVVNNAVSSLAASSASSVAPSAKPHFNSAYQNYMKQMGEVDANVQNANISRVNNDHSGNNVSTSLLGTINHLGMGALRDDASTPSINTSNAQSSASDDHWIYDDSIHNSATDKNNSTGYLTTSDIPTLGYEYPKPRASYTTDSDYNNAISDINNYNSQVATSMYSNGTTIMSNYASTNSMSPSDSNVWVYANASGFYNGTYRYNKALNAIEFLNGTLDDSGNYQEPSLINNAQSIKFDNVTANGYGTNGRKDELNRLFTNYPNLKSIDILGLSLSSDNLKNSTSINTSDAQASASDDHWIYDGSIKDNTTGSYGMYLTTSDIPTLGYEYPKPRASYATYSDYNNAISDINNYNSQVATSMYSNGTTIMSNYASTNSMSPSDSNVWVYANASGFYNGTYRYNKALNAIEFLNGTLDDSGKYSEPSLISDAQSIKFDNVTANGYGFNGKRDELNHLFANYPKLKSIDVSGLSLSNDIRYLRGLFESDWNLSDLIFTKFNKSRFDELFDKLKSNKSIKLNTSDVINDVINMSYNISKFNTSGVINMSYMFAGDTSIKSITFPDTFDTTGVIYGVQSGEVYYGELGMFLGTELHRITINNPVNTVFESSFYNKENRELIGPYLNDYKNDFDANGDASDYKAVSPWHLGSPIGQNYNLETGNGLPTGTYYNSDYYPKSKPSSNHSNIDNEYRVDFHTSIETSSITSNGQTISSAIPLTNIAGKYNSHYDNKSQLDNQPVSSADDGYVLPANDFNKHTLKTSDANGPGDEYGWVYATSDDNGHYHILQPNDTLSFDKNKVANLYVFPMYQGLIYTHNDNTKSSDGKTINFLSGHFTKAHGFMNNAMDSDSDSIAEYHANTINFDDDVYTDKLDQASKSDNGFAHMFTGSNLKKVSFGKHFWTGDYSESDMFMAPNLEYITISSPHTKFGNTTSDNTGLENYPSDSVPAKQGTWYDKTEPNQGPVVIKSDGMPGFNPNAYISSPDGTPNVWTSNVKVADNVSDKIQFVVFGNEKVPVPKPSKYGKYTELLPGVMNSDLKLTSSDIPVHYSTTDSISDIDKSIKYDGLDHIHTIQLTPNNVSYAINYLEPLGNNRFKLIHHQPINGYYIPNDPEYPSLPSGYEFSHEYDTLGGPVQDIHNNNYGYTMTQNGDSYNVYVTPARVGEIVNYVVNDNNVPTNGQTFSGFTKYGTSYGADSNASFTIASSNSSYDVTANGIVTSANVPAGYKIISGQSLSNLHYSDGTKIIYIMPNSASATVDYQVSLGNNTNSTVGSEVFSGNSYSASGVGNNSSVLTSANFHIYNTREHGANDLASYWNLVSPSTNVDYANNTYDVDVTPIQVTDTINYQYNNSTLAKQAFTGNDYRAFGYSADNDVLNVTSANDTDIPKNYSLSSSNNYFDYISGSNYYVDIAPDSASTTVQYTYDSNIISSNSDLNGNSVGASGALNSSADITSYNDTGIPKGYHLDLTQTYAPYDNKPHQVAIVPDSVAVHYIYHNHTISQQLFTGNQFSQASFNNNQVTVNPKLPIGYHLSSGSNISVSFGSNNIQDVNIVPDTASTTINYDYNGNQISGNTVLSGGSLADASGASSTSTDITSSNDSGIPNGYHLDLNNTNVPYDNANNQNPHQIAVVPDRVTVNYQYNSSTVSTSVYKGNQFSQASLNGNQFTVIPSLVSGYSVSNGNGYILNNSAITIPFSSNAKEVDVSLSYDFTPTQSSANTNASDVSKANNSVNSSEAWLSSASSINALASGYAASADLDTNSSEINFQFGWDNQNYQQISSLAQLINSADTQASNYANDINSAASSSNVSRANNDLSNTSSELSLANSVTTQASNVLKAMTTESPQKPSGSIAIRYVDIHKNNSEISTSNTNIVSEISGTIGTSVSPTFVSSISGYIDQGIGSNDGFTFASGSNHYININVVSDQSDSNVQQLMSSSADNQASGVASVGNSIIMSLLSSASSANTMTQQAINNVFNDVNSAYNSLSSANDSNINTGNSVIASQTSSLSNSASSASTSTSVSISNSNNAVQIAINQINADVQSNISSYDTSVSNSAQSAIATQSSTDYQSANDVISQANSIIASQGRNEYNLSNSADSMAKYADGVERQAVIQATDNDKSNVNSQSTSDSNSANAAKQSVSNSTSTSASVSASTALTSQSGSDYKSGSNAVSTANSIIMSLINSASVAITNQNNRDVNEAVYNENYLISLSKSLSASATSTENRINSSASSSASAALSSTVTSLSNSASSAVKSTMNSANSSANNRYTSDSNAKNSAVSSATNSASSSANSAMNSAMTSAKQNCSSEQASVSTSASNSAKNAINSLAQYADNVEHQAVSQATSNDQNNVANSPRPASSSNSTNAQGGSNANKSLASSANQSMSNSTSTPSGSTNASSQSSPSQSSTPMSTTSVTPSNSSVAPLPNSSIASPSSSSAIPSRRSTAGVIKHESRQVNNDQKINHRTTRATHTDVGKDVVKFTFNGHRVTTHAKVGPYGHKDHAITRQAIERWIPEGYTISPKTMLHLESLTSYHFNNKTLTIPLVRIGGMEYIPKHSTPSYKQKLIKQNVNILSHQINQDINNLQDSLTAYHMINGRPKIIRGSHKLPQTRETQSYSALYAMLFVLSSVVMAGLGRAIDKRRHE